MGRQCCGTDPKDVPQAKVTLKSTIKAHKMKMSQNRSVVTFLLRTWETMKNTRRRRVQKRAGLFIPSMKR